MTDNYNQLSEYELQLLASSAADGDPEAQFMLGEYMIEHSGAQEDIALAAQLITMAAQQDYEPARAFLTSLGIFGMEQAGEEETPSEENLLREAEAGDPEAQYQLALSYMDREDGEEKDHAMAMEWFARAAENGHKMAGDQLRFWNYVDRLKEQSMIPEDADFMQVMETVIGLADSGDAEAQAVL